jgi:hypothetical protein
MYFLLLSPFFRKEVVKQEHYVLHFVIYAKALQNQSLCSSTNSCRRQAVSISLAYGFFWEARA